MTYRHWTADEIEELKLRYPSEPTEAIALDMNRTFASVRMRAKKLKLGKPPVFWKQEDIELLRELYPHLPNHEVANRLGRTKKSVRCKAQSEGLRKRSKPRGREDSPWRKLYPQNLCRVPIQGWAFNAKNF